MIDAHYQELKHEILTLRRLLRDVTAAFGALEGNGSTSNPLAVRVDNITIQINANNELEAIGSGSPGGSPGSTLDPYHLTFQVYTTDGSPIVTGIQTAAARAKLAGTITKAFILADAVGSLTIDVLRDSFANYPPTGADSITNGNFFTLSANDAAEDTDLSNWSDLTVTEGDVYKIDIKTTDSLISSFSFVLEVMP